MLVTGEVKTPEIVTNPPDVGPSTDVVAGDIEFA